jgi:hypothetical protein
MAFLQSAKTTLQSMVKPFTPSFRFLAKTLSVWMALLGLILIVIGAAKPFEWPENYFKVLDSVGSAVLVGGVFGVLLKSLQYSGVFKTELSKIIYGREQMEDSSDLVTTFRNELCSMIYGAENTAARGDVLNALIKAFQGVVYENQALQQKKDLKDLWETISVAVYKTKYPEISEDIVRKVTQEYFPSGDTFYYNQFEESISLTLKPDKKYIETREVVTLRVKAVESSEPLDWQYAWRLEKDPTDTTDTKICLDKIKIDDVDKTAEHPITTEIVENGKALVATLAIKLEGAAEYKLRLELRMTSAYELNRQRDMKSRRFIKKPEFRVEYNPDDFELDFVPVGTREDAYEPQGEDFSRIIWNVYKDLIFPNQGYRLVLHRR